MAVTGVQMQTGVAAQAAEDITNICRNIPDMVRGVNEGLDEMGYGAEGTMVEKLKEFGKDVYQAALDLGSCFVDLGTHIGDFIKNMVTHNDTALEEMRAKIESRSGGR